MADRAERLSRPGFRLAELPPKTYGAFWARLCAALIDGFIVLTLCYVIGVAFYLDWGQPEGDLSKDEAILLFVKSMMTAVPLSIFVGWQYHARLESSAKQSSWGKRIFGLRVTDRFGGRVTWRRASARHFAKLLSALPIFIGFLLAAVTHRKQALHDLIAGTLVVKA